MRLHAGNEDKKMYSHSGDDTCGVRFCNTIISITNFDPDFERIHPSISGSFSILDERFPLIELMYLQRNYSWFTFRKLVV